MTAQSFEGYDAHARVLHSQWWSYTSIVTSNTTEIQLVEKTHRSQRLNQRRAGDIAAELLIHDPSDYEVSKADSFNMQLLNKIAEFCVMYTGVSCKFDIIYSLFS